jgi:hypothetical protein
MISSNRRWRSDKEKVSENMVTSLVHVQDFPKRPSGTGDEMADGFFAAIHLFCRLLKRETMHMPQDNSVSLILRQLLQRGGYLQLALVLLEALAGLGLSDGHDLFQPSRGFGHNLPKVLFAPYVALHRLVFATFVPYDVLDDSFQPLHELRLSNALELLSVLMSLEKRLLDQVRRIETSSQARIQLHGPDLKLQEQSVLLWLPPQATSHAPT